MPEANSLKESEVARTRILVVDDSPTALAFTAAVLRDAAYEVRTCDTIWVSSDVAEFHPDLILIDVNMGSCRGTSVVTALRNRSFTENIVLVLHSTLPSTELARLTEECGAHGFIHKTDDAESLKRQVRGFLHSGYLSDSQPVRIASLCPPKGPGHGSQMSSRTPPIMGR